MTLSLRTRYIAAILLVVGVLASVFTVAMSLFVEVLEEELLENTLGRELEERRLRLVNGSHVSLPINGDLREIIVARDALGELPVELRKVQPGLAPGDIDLEGHTYMVGRADVGDQRLYVLLDIARIERIEATLKALAVVTALAAAVFGIAIGVALSRRVMRPVSQFAAEVAALDPTQPSMSVDDHSMASEIQPIAIAINQFLGRLSGFIERERAFTGDVSHELRTPLAVTRSAVELLLNDASLAPQARARAERIRRAAERMEAITLTMLFLAREHTGLESPICSLSSLAVEAIDNLEHSTHSRGVKVELVVEAEQVVRAPPAMVMSILQNLLSNAISVSTHTVTLRISSDQFSVEDTGPGLAPATPEQMFERGYRGPESAGAGLGLHIVRRLVDHLGWAIEIRDQPGRGVTFVVTHSSATVYPVSATAR